MKWYCKSYRDAILAFETNEINGLSEIEANARKEKFGLNKLAQKNKTSMIVKFFMQFNDFMIIILIAAAVMSFAVSWINGERDFIDPVIILLIVVINAALGLIQESKAEKSLEALQKMSSPTTKVLRDGKLIQVNTEEIVPGDIISLETGDLAPADARLITSINLKAEESALTGESLPVEKDADFISKETSSIGDRRNMVFSGSTISYGRGTAVVTDIGMNTEVGKIADMIINDESPATPLQKKLEETGKILGIGALVICLAIFVMGIFRNIPPFQMFMTSVSLAVAAIPEGLPAIVTIMLAIGVQRMAKQNAIIRKLPAVETLGSASVICSDKTGTLTQNKMTVVEIWCGGNISGHNKPQSEREILRFSTMCNDTTLNEIDGEIKLLGDPTESALVTAAYKLGINKNTIDIECPRVNEIPFDSKRKLMSTIHKKSNGEYLVITKGAPDVLINKCNYYNENGINQNINTSIKAEISKQNYTMADKALRVLAVAYKTLRVKPQQINEDTIENDLIFVGLIGMIDPPRMEALAAVTTCKTAGIKPVMVTGDHVITATAIARKLGIMELGGSALTGEALNKMSQKELIENIYSYSVFARVSPEHKVRIVKAFQAKGAIVAMTGDGVNDAPALKAADIGCAMGISGTDVAKGAADMVLTDDNFATIVDAVREGRGIYSNIRKAVHFLLSSNIGEIITILVSIVLGWATPLLAIHLLWVNLVTDSLPAIALGVDPPEKGIMHNKPINNHKSLFSDGLMYRIAFEGLMIGMLAIIAFGVGSIYFDELGEHTIGRTMAFATLSISQLVHAFNMRSEQSILKINILENIYLVGAFFTGLFLQTIVISFPPLASIFKVTPLGTTQWTIVAILCFMPLLIVELQKYFSTLLLFKTKFVTKI